MGNKPDEMERNQGKGYEVRLGTVGDRQYRALHAKAKPLKVPWG